MVSEIKLTITEKDKIIHTLSKEILSTQSLVKTIEDFQQTTNAKLTKMIEELCGSDHEEMDEEDGDVSDDDEEEDTTVIPNKRKR